MTQLAYKARSRTWSLLRLVAESQYQKPRLLSAINKRIRVGVDPTDFTIARTVKHRTEAELLIINIPQTQVSLNTKT